MTTFDYLNDIIKFKTGKLHLHPQFKDTWNSFMICRWLSMSKNSLKAAAKANELALVLDAKQMYLFLTKEVPQSNQTFIKYIKKKKVKKGEDALE
jgi:hypothetical protein